MTNNISEYTRLEEELGELIGTVRDLRLPKAHREGALRQVREIERILGLEPKDYVHGR
jgi:hypothetical protein